MDKAGFKAKFKRGSWTGMVGTFLGMAGITLLIYGTMLKTEGDTIMELGQTQRYTYDAEIEDLDDLERAHGYKQSGGIAAIVFGAVFYLVGQLMAFFSAF